MLAKLCIVIMAVTLTAASMLTVRQQRLDAVYDLARSLERAAAHDRQLQEVRIDIARRVTPDAVMRMAGRVGPFEPIPLEWCDPLPSVLTASTMQDPGRVTGMSPLRPAGDDPPSEPQADERDRTTLGPAFDERETAE